jgi:hypothetical protein
MKNSKNDNPFGADEVIITSKEPNSTIKHSKEEIKQINQENKNKYLKMYELNEEGLRQFGVIKKQHWLTTIKWSFFGTVFGFSLSTAFDFGFRRMNPVKRDYIKTGILMGSVGLFTLHGFNISNTEFRKKQNELVIKYGKEVK